MILLAVTPPLLNNLRGEYIAERVVWHGSLVSLGSQSSPHAVSLSHGERGMPHLFLTSAIWGLGEESPDATQLDLPFQPHGF